MQVEERKVFMSENVADPTALGLFGLAMVCFVNASLRMEWTLGTSYVIPWAILLGSLGQMIASYFDFKKNNAFGSVVFGAYGLFWSAMAFLWMIKSGILGQAFIAQADPKQLGFAFMGYLIFSLFATLAATATNKVVLAIMILIDFLFLGLVVDSFKLASWGATLAAFSELPISLLGFYGAGATLVNRVVGKTVLPMGAKLNIW